MEDLGIEVILENMRPRLAFALHGHAGPDDFRQAVNVVGLDAAVSLDAAAHGLRPRLGAKDAGAQGQVLELDARLRRLVNQVEKVAGGAADGRDAKILHHHQLAGRVAPGNRDDRCAQRLGAVVRAQPAGEQAVAIGILDDVALVQPAGGQAAQHDIGPNLHILLGVGDDNGLARGAAGGVQPHDLPHRAGKQAKGIRVAQIVLPGERQLGQVVQRLHVPGSQVAFLHALAEQGDAVVGALDRGFQPLELQVPQPRQRQKIRRAERVEVSL